MNAIQCDCGQTVGIGEAVIKSISRKKGVDNHQVFCSKRSNDGCNMFIEIRITPTGTIKKVKMVEIPLE